MSLGFGLHSLSSQSGMNSVADAVRHSQLLTVTICYISKLGMLHVRKQPALSIPMSPTGGADTLTKDVSRCQAALRDRLSEALATLCGP